MQQRQIIIKLILNPPWQGYAGIGRGYLQEVLNIRTGKAEAKPSGKNILHELLAQLNSNATVRLTGYGVLIRQKTGLQQHLINHQTGSLLLKKSTSSDDVVICNNADLIETAAGLLPDEPERSIILGMSAEVAIPAILTRA